MPAAPKTSAEDIVAAALKLLETRGLDAVNMQAVAVAAGIKGPSLYKRYATRDLLLDDVAREGLLDLEARMGPARTVAAKARAYRQFALERPQLYGLLYAAREEGGDLVARRGEVAKPIIEALGSLAAARLLTAWLHGFVSMELAGAFRLGGDTEKDFEWGLSRLLESSGDARG
ncbi:MAG: TetR/AcrR family transcriptional regulator [Myxococcaceae bacterium]|nr:TetR/AcrR family transcriptional regulator [Myxococcaceae bacterium]